MSAAVGRGYPADLCKSAAPVAPQALDIYLSSTPSAGEVFRGGYFVPFAVNLADSLDGVSARVFVPDAQGGRVFDNPTKLSWIAVV